MEDLIIEKEDWKVDIVWYRALLKRAKRISHSTGESIIVWNLITAKTNRELAKAIKKSNKSSDRLSIIWLLLSLSLVLIWYSQVIIWWEWLNKIFLWWNIGIILIFILIYLFIFRKWKK